MFPLKVLSSAYCSIDFSTGIFASHKQNYSFCNLDSNNIALKMTSTALTLIFGLIPVAFTLVVEIPDRFQGLFLSFSILDLFSGF